MTQNTNPMGGKCSAANSLLLVAVLVGFSTDDGEEEFFAFMFVVVVTFVVCFDAFPIFCLRFFLDDLFERCTTIQIQSDLCLFVRNKMAFLLELVGRPIDSLQGRYFRLIQSQCQHDLKTKHTHTHARPSIQNMSIGHTKKKK